MVRGSSVYPPRAALVLGLLLGGSLLAVPVHASPPPSLDLRGFQASTDPKASLYLEPAGTPGHLQWSVGAWASYAYRLVQIEDASDQVVSVPVRHQLSLDVVERPPLPRTQHQAPSPPDHSGSRSGTRLSPAQPARQPSCRARIRT